MDGTGEHYANRNKASDEREIPYDLTFNRNLTNKTKNEQNRTRNIETRNSLTLTRGEGEGEKGERKGKGLIKEQV